MSVPDSATTRPVGIIHTILGERPSKNSDVASVGKISPATEIPTGTVIKILCKKSNIS